MGNMDSRMQKFFTPKVLMGDTRDWDMSLLCFALLYSSHTLIPIGDDARQLVEGLRDLRNNKLAHISACSMQREELWEAVRKMDDFIEYCLPSEWELWLTTSREILDQDPMDFEDGHTPNLRRPNLDNQAGSNDQVVIQIDAESEEEEEEMPGAESIHTLLDRISTPHHTQFMDEPKTRWLSELSTAAALSRKLSELSEFSVASVRFTA